MMTRSIRILVFLFVAGSTMGQKAFSPEQLERWRKRFPEADANKDGQLTVEEGLAYLQKRRGGRGNSRGGGAPRQFAVDAGWEGPEFPVDAVFRKSPEAIKAIYAEVAGRGEPAVVSFDPPANGALRIVGTGHSFMRPGYNTLPRITEAAGFTQPLHTHIGGGMTGSTRYKWEEENGIFQFDGAPKPKLLASIANADWDAMMWGPYFNDRPQYYTCWMDFCLKYHPEMKFYLSDAWIQLYQVGQAPKAEDYFTEEVIERLGKEKRELYLGLVDAIDATHPGKVFIMPTSDAMTLAAQHFIRGELPQIEGLHTVVGGKTRSLWRDYLGHLGPGFDRLEGYVFYATLYGKSPELIAEPIAFADQSDGFPNAELDRVFRKIAWQAVIHHPRSGVKDEDGDGHADATVTTDAKTEEEDKS